MSTPSTLILLGVLILLFPYLGLPHVWSNLFIAIFGIIVFAIGFGLRNRAVKIAEHTTNPPPPTTTTPEHHEPSTIA